MLNSDQDETSVIRVLTRHFNQTFIFNLSGNQFDYMCYLHFSS